MLSSFLEFFYSHFKCDVTFKITNQSKLNKLHFKINNNFKSHVIFKITLKKL